MGCQQTPAMVFVSRSSAGLCPLIPGQSGPKTPGPTGTNTMERGACWTAFSDVSGHDARRLWIKHIPQKISKHDIHRAFKKFGPIKDVHLIKNKDSGRLRDFCFVTFREEASAQSALEAARDGLMWVGSRLVTAQFALPPPSRHRPLETQQPAPAAPEIPRARRRRPRRAGARHMDQLPAELLERILSLLPLRHQLVAQTVSRRWQALVHGLLGRRREILLGQDFADGGEDVGLSSEQLRELLQLTTGLRRLDTGPLHLCPYDTINHITVHCPDLVSLDMSGSSFPCSYQRLRRLVRSCSRLEEITLPTFYIYDEETILLLLRHLKHLRRLELRPGTLLTGQSLALLPSSMRRLRLPLCSRLESTYVRHVARCGELRELDLSSASRLRTEDLTAALAGCPRLRWLAVTGLSAPAELCLPPAGLTQLEYLDLGKATGVTDGTLSRLPDLTPTLVTLNIQGCDGVTEAGLCQLSRLGRLQSLDLGYQRGVSDHVLQLLADLPLKELRLAQDCGGPARFSIEGVVSLALSCCRLTLLDLSCVEHLAEELLDQLGQPLPDSRTLSIYVGDTPLERWPRPVPDHVRLLQYITVPVGGRRQTAAQLWKDNDDDEEEEVPTIADWRRPPRA